MSMPPLNPEKTAAGIIVDPRTLERVVPSTRRQDGTTRKELKIRPGFTPQEDVGRFRPTRQTTNNPSLIPGTNRPAPAKKHKEENPFAQDKVAKTKAQMKNERRREKKREMKSWDESSSEDEGEEGGGLKEDFARVDEDKELNGGVGVGVGSEDAFPPLGGKGKGGGEVPDQTVVQAEGGVSTPPDKREEQDMTDIPSPPPGASDVPETASELPSTPPLPTTETPSQPPRTAQPPRSSQSSSSSAKPPATSKRHPIQGGRDGPLGLAHPPPIEPERKAPPSRWDKGSWRTATTSAAAKPGSKPKPSHPAPAPPPKPATPEPRVRKEVRVREGGANDISSLASRVKNLVLDNQKPPREREKKQEAESGKA